MPKIGDRYQPRSLSDFTAFEDWLSRIPCSDLCWNEKSVFARLRRFGDNSGEIFPSTERLAVELGMEQRTVERVIASLEDKLWIERSRQKNAPSRFFLIRTKYIPGTDATEWQTTKLSNDKVVERQSCRSETTDLSFASLGSEETNLRDKETPIVPLQASQDQLQTKELETDGSETLIGFDDFALLAKRILPKFSGAAKGKALSEWPDGMLVTEGMAVSILAWIKNLKKSQSPYVVRAVWSLKKQFSPIRMSPVAKSVDQAEPRTRQTEVPSSRPLPEIATQWNTVVSAGAPVGIWTKELQQLVDMCCQTHNFLEEWVPKLFLKCRPLCASEKGKFITFEWALKNWTKIINGGCDWVLSRDGPADKPKYESATDRKRRANEEADREAEEAVRKSKEIQDGKHT